jgi:hypothetical protein
MEFEKYVQAIIDYRLHFLIFVQVHVLPVQVVQVLLLSSVWDTFFDDRWFCRRSNVSARVIRVNLLEMLNADDVSLYGSSGSWYLYLLQCFIVVQAAGTSK